MNKFKAFVIAASVFAAGTTFAQKSDCGDTTKYGDVQGTVKGVITLYGQDFSEAQVITINELLSNYSQYADKEVMVEGEITDVCQKAGCWAMITDGKTNVRVKTDHEYFIPKDSYNKKAIFKGKFIVNEISEDMARHYNEEAKNKTVKTEDIKGPQKVFQIVASGVKITETPNNDVKNDGGTDCSKNCHK